MENIAVIKFDANLVTLIIAQMDTYGSYSVLERIEENLKISEDLERDGMILKSKIAEALIVLKGFNKIIASYNCTQTYPVITNILNEAKNIKSFLEEIRSATALNFKILEKKDEAEKVYLSVINTVDVPKGVIINISSEATQFIMYNRKQILACEELDFGDFTLAKKFENSELSAQERNKEMFNYVSDKLQSIEMLKNFEDEVQFVGVGGSFLTLAKLARKIKRYPMDNEHSYYFTKADYEATNNVLKDLGADKTKKLKGISEARADVLVSGLNIVGAILSHLNTDKILLSRFDYEDGILINHGISKRENNNAVDVLTNSLNAFNRFQGTGERATEIYEYASMLYKELKVLHKLPRQFNKILKIASYLSNCGVKLSYANKEKAAFSTIINADILGASHRDIVLSAFIVASQELDNFNLSEWVKYKDILEETDLDAVKKLAIILRIAKAFDRAKSGIIKDIQCDTLGDSVILKTIVEKDATLEIREALKIQSDFKKAFNYTLEVL